MRKLLNVGICAVAYLTLFSSLIYATSLKVSWNACADSDLDGYYVYYGTQSGRYDSIVPVKNNTSCIISQVQEGYTYYVSVTSFDLSGNESSFSSEVYTQIPVLTPDNSSTGSDSGYETSLLSAAENLISNQQLSGEVQGQTSFMAAAGSLILMDESAEDRQEDISSIQPEITFPENNQEDVDLRPILKADSRAEEYAAVQWEISNDEGEVLLDLKTEKYRSELLVPDMILSAGTKHFCRVRYINSEGMYSEWSEPVAFFTVEKDVEDTDRNGIPDDQEQLAGEEVDLDYDGVVDNEQSGMKSLVTVIGDEPVSLEKSTNCRSIEAFKSIDPMDIDEEQGKPEELPIGLLGFKVTVDNPGDFAEVIIHLSEPAPVNAKWYMYDDASGWRVYPHATFSEDRMNVVLQLKDGEREYGDADGVVNGIIIDPSGPGVGNSEEGTCFISASDSKDSPLPSWVSMLIVFMVAVTACRRSRPRGRQ